MKDSCKVYSINNDCFNQNPTIVSFYINYFMNTEYFKYMTIVFCRTPSYIGN